LKAAAGLLVLGGVASAQEPDAVSFQRDVRPLLMARCAGCHQPAKAEGRLDVTSYARLRAHDDVVVPGDAGASLLIELVLELDGEPPEMPKDRLPLEEEQVALLARWIDAGALDDTPVGRATSGAPEVYARLPVITSLDVSPDGAWLAVSGAGEVLLHRYTGGLEARLAGLSERVEGLAFSPDGARLAVVGGSPARFGEVQVWDVARRRLDLSVQVTFDTLRGVSWSPDGTRLAFGCADRSLRAIDAGSGAEVLFQGAHEDWVLDTIWSTDASHLVSVSRDRSMKLVKVETSQFIDNITSITPCSRPAPTASRASTACTARRSASSATTTTCCAPSPHSTAGCATCAGCPARSRSSSRRAARAPARCGCTRPAPRRPPGRTRSRAACTRSLAIRPAIACSARGRRASCSSSTQRAGAPCARSSPSPSSRR
jgi:hypothetical protein